MNSRKIAMETFFKYSLFALCVFFLYIFQGTPGFLSLFGLKPVLILPFCLTLAILDDSQNTVIVFLIGGLLTELSCSRVIGIFTIPLLLLCSVGEIAVKFFFQSTLRNTCIFVLIAMFLMLSTDFFFIYILPGYTGNMSRYFKTVILGSVYATVFTPLYYKIIFLINQKLVRFDAR